jgi:hypothetical protein
MKIVYRAGRSRMSQDTSIADLPAQPLQRCKSGPARDVLK